MLGFHEQLGVSGGERVCCKFLDNRRMCPKITSPETGQGAGNHQHEKDGGKDPVPILSKKNIGLKGLHGIPALPPVPFINYFLLNYAQLYHKATVRKQWKNLIYLKRKRPHAFLPQEYGAKPVRCHFVRRMGVVLPAMIT